MKAVTCGLTTISMSNDDDKKTVAEARTFINFEVVIGYIGDLGKYQIALVLLAYWITIPAGMHQVASVFLAAIPDHRCKIPPYDDNSTFYPEITEEEMINKTIPKDSDGEYDSCARYNYSYINCVNGSLDCIVDSNYITTESCKDGYVYDDSVYSSTVSTEWDLVCDRLVLGTSVTAFYYVGVLFSALIGGNVADKIGRLPTMLISQLCMSAVGIACAFAPTLVAFAMLRFGVALFLMAGFLSCFVYVMEITGDKWRTFVGINIQTGFSIGYMTLSGLAYNWRDWRQLQLVISLFPLPFIICYFLMPESPRWLFSQGKTKKAKEISEMIARRNGRPLPPKVWEEATQKLEVVEEFDLSPLELFKRPRMRRITINVMFQWFVISLVYYGLSLNVGSLAGDDYVNNTLNGMVEIVSFVIVILTMDRWGRRLLLTLSLLIGGIACISSTIANTLADGNEAILTLGTTLALIGKCAVSGSFAIIYNFTAELYPTKIRSTAVGVGSMSARIGSILTPYTILLQYIIPWLTSTVFGVFSLIACFASLTFPETMGIPLMTSLEEAEEFYERGRSMFLENEDFEEEKQEKIGHVNSTYL